MTEQSLRIHDFLFEPFLSAEQIKSRVKQLAEQLNTQYAGTHPVFLPILNGSFIFAADLIRAVDFECEVSFVKLASYEGLKSTGEVSTRLGIDAELKGRPVIIIEDIVDTGNTLSQFIPVLQKFEPQSIEIVSLLRKPTELKHQLEVKYVGFDIPSKFVIGYGLDYDGLGRGLPGVYQLADQAN